MNAVARIEMNCSERGAFHWGMMALIQRLPPAARKPAGLFWLAVSFFFPSLFFSFPLHWPSASTFTVRGRAQSLRVHAVVCRTYTVFRRLMNSDYMGEHELEWGLYSGQYICWMMRWTHPRLFHLALMNKLWRGRRVTSEESPRLCVLRSMMHRLLLRLVSLPPHPQTDYVLCGGTETPRGVAMFRKGGGGVGHRKWESKKKQTSAVFLCIQIILPDPHAVLCRSQFSRVWAPGVILPLKDLFFHSA